MSPPNWPAPPEGWFPPPGWAPAPDWPPAPAGWQFWVTDDQPANMPPRRGDVAFSAPDDKVSVFGARQRVHELSAELAQLRRHMAELGALDVIELQKRRDTLQTEIADQDRRLLSAR